MGKVLEYEQIEMNSHRESATRQSSRDCGSRGCGGCDTGKSVSHYTPQVPSTDNDISLSDSIEGLHEGQAINPSNRQSRTIDFEALYKSQQEDTEIEQKESRKKHGIISVSLSVLIFISCISMQQECSFQTETECLTNFIKPNIYRWAMLIIFNGIASRYVYEILIAKQTKWQVALASWIFTLYVFALYDTKITTTYYMGVINYLNLLSFAVFFVLFRFASAIRMCLYSNTVVCILMLLVSILAGTFIINGRVIKPSCDYWNSSITSHNPINNSISGMCNITPPEICWDSITHKWQDLSFFFNLPSCSVDGDQLPVSPFIESNNKPRFAAFPAVSKGTQKEMINSVEHFDSLEEARSQGKEIILDETHMHYSARVNFNAELAKQAAAISAKNQAKLVKNILAVSVSGYSRASMHLKLPKTLAWFEKHADSRQAVEFYRYNSHSAISDVNVKATQMSSIVKDLKSAGFVTGITSDACKDYSFADHSGVGFACDPNYQDVEKQKTLSSGASSIVKRCLYGTELSQYMFDYAGSFLQSYKESSKALELEFNYSSDMTGEVINHLDQPLADFLESVMVQGHLEDTLVILYSDNGSHSRGVFNKASFDQAQIENNLPGLFMSMPASVGKAAASEALKANQQVLVTQNNLYHFIQHVLQGDTYSQKAQSLLSPLDKQLQCVQLGIPDANCSCK